MLTEERQGKILSMLEDMGSVTVQQLMTELDASESTIRRDLTSLDANGMLTKVHGGAILKNTVFSTTDDEVTHRKEQNKEAKDRIARVAAEQILPGDFVYVDAGTTTERMIDYITAKNAVFVTNAITHAKKLAERGGDRACNTCRARRQDARHSRDMRWKSSTDESDNRRARPLKLR